MFQLLCSIGRHTHFRRFSELPNKLQIRHSCDSSCQPKERLLEVVVALGTDIIVLNVLSSVESHVLSLDDPLCRVHLVANQDHGNVGARPHQVTVPSRHILVSDTRGHIEHENGSLGVYVIAISQSTKLFLSSGIPNIERNWPIVRLETQRVHLHAQRRNIALLKFTCQVTLDQRSFAHTAIAHQDKFKLLHSTRWSSCVLRGCRTLCTARRA
mmetsp:Transcript_8073/g.18896  ORF Transcript_8073/g.18896 Transcript_8073/m.18896 type:complete len:213 (-) Transcript_8073:158-796(-)